MIHVSDRTSETVLSVRDVSISFTVDGRDVVAVPSASWELRRGEVLAVVGESGSGKSATALAVVGLLPPGARARGTIEFDGRNLLDLPESELRELRGTRIAMVFQDPLNSLDPVFTVGFQLTELLRVHDHRMTAAGARTRALELLRSVDLPDPELKFAQYPHQLSGG